jgi:hypothetical protein
MFIVPISYFLVKFQSILPCHKSTKWRAVHSRSWRLNVDDEKYEDFDVLCKDIERHLKKEDEFIKEIENALLGVFEDA